MAVLDEVLTAADSEERLTEWGVEAYQTAFASYVAKKQPEKCLPILRRIIAYYRADSPEHISHRRYVAQLRLVYKQMGDPENEEQVLLQLLDLCRKYDGEKSLNVADTLHSLGECRLGQQKFGPAAEVLQDALRLRLELKPDGWSQFDTRRRLGEARLGMKEFSEAERQLLQAHEGLTEHRPKVGRAIDAPVAHARQLLGELYAATGRPDEAARWKGSPPSVGK
jgi:tetratricopeptide (TPR) repeat protein